MTLKKCPLFTLFTNIQKRLGGNFPECSTELTTMIDFGVQGSTAGNLAQCSTESALIIKLLAQGSIKPKPSWLVPLLRRKMLENKWKPVLRLFYRKMLCYSEIREACGSCVELSPLKIFGSMFDTEAIHAQFPSNIQPNYHQAQKTSKIEANYHLGAHRKKADEKEREQEACGRLKEYRRVSGGKQ